MKREKRSQPSYRGVIDVNVGVRGVIAVIVGEVDTDSDGVNVDVFEKAQPVSRVKIRAINRRFMTKLTPK